MKCSVCGSEKMFEVDIIEDHVIKQKVTFAKL